MEEKFCRLQFPGGRQVRVASARLTNILLVAGLVLLVSMGAAGYFYWQLAEYRSEKAEFTEYKQNKKEQQAKLQQLVNDNETMLRDMAEISNLEKKLRRAIIRDVDSSKLSGAAIGTEAPAVSSQYKGKGSGRILDSKTTMAVLQTQNANIRSMLDGTKSSVTQLLGEVEGRSGTLAGFPDLWPTEGGVISSTYGGRSNPVMGSYEYHSGVDIAVDFGTPVYAAAAGDVEQAGLNGGYGRYVRIDHGNGYKTAYGHMSGLAVAAGQQVIKGEIIGFVGSSGYSTGPHLHYEVLVDGSHVDPGYVLKR